MFSFKIVIPLLGIRDPELKVMNMHVLCSFYAVYYLTLEGVGIKLILYTDWMAFLPSNLMGEISPNPEVLSAKT